MRKVKAQIIKEHVKQLLLKANYDIGLNTLNILKKAQENEVSKISKSVLEQIIENDKIAKNERIPMCQDTGMAVVFVEIGHEVFVDGNLYEAINQGVREAYKEGYLRKSVVDDPIFERANTKDNTPAVIHVDIVQGNVIKIHVAPKGFGSENMSAIRMLKPADGVNGVKEFIIETVKNAGPNPCPPIVLGIGIGGTFEKSALLAKKALLREIGKSNNNIKYAELENSLLKEINELGIGPAGLGGKTTALAVNIEYYPTHIAGLPVAVNICCHAYRHGFIEI